MLTRFTQQADSRAVKVIEGYRLDNLLLELNERSKITFGTARWRVLSPPLIRQRKNAKRRPSQSRGAVQSLIYHNS